jgi:hypothetical protein
VLSAGLQLVAVTALYEPGKSLRAIEALRGVWFLYLLDLPRTLEVCHPRRKKLSRNGRETAV